MSLRGLVRHSTNNPLALAAVIAIALTASALFVEPAVPLASSPPPAACPCVASPPAP